MLTYSVFLKKDRERVIQVINSVAAENGFLQTGGYIPTEVWEGLLETGADKKRGYLLITICDGQKVVGFGRLSPDDMGGRCSGNIGVVLLPEYRYKRIGTKTVHSLKIK